MLAMHPCTAQYGSKAGINRPIDLHNKIPASILATQPESLAATFPFVLLEIESRLCADGDRLELAKPSRDRITHVKDVNYSTGLADGFIEQLPC